VVLLAIGFETTAPTIAATILEARRNGRENFSVFSVLKVLPPALRALLEPGECDLDGLILPGHVSALIGRRALDFVASEFHIPSVITGFEDDDLILGLATLLKVLDAGKAAVVNAYTHVVREEGNREAMAKVSQCFEEGDALWRGLGPIPFSGLKLKPGFARYNAVERLPLQTVDTFECGPCRCGEVISGRMTPAECPLFEKVCNPASPAGPCMVSSEGACAAYYHYRRWNGIGIATP